MSLLRRDFIKTLLARVGSTLSERTDHNLWRNQLCGDR